MVQPIRLNRLFQFDDFLLDFLELAVIDLELKSRSIVAVGEFEPLDHVPITSPLEALQPVHSPSRAVFARTISCIRAISASREARSVCAI